jgi:limonene-1,2-epoxide hydrolase
VLSDAFITAVESWDRDAAAAALADDVSFRSPVVFKAYEGRDATLAVLDAVSRVFEDFAYIDRIEGDRTAALIFRARVGERELEGLDHLTFDDDGRVSELRVMVRPMTGMVALAEAMQRELEALG